MNSFKFFAFSTLLVALVVPLSVDWIEAQKTSSGLYEQQVSVSAGAAPNAVYGGYGGQQRPTALVAPVIQPQRRVQPIQQTIVSREQTEAVRQPFIPAVRQPFTPAVRQPLIPAVQQQVEYSSSSSSSYEQSQPAEADAEPASYGSVNGQPGQDFPNYARVPKTSFSCEGLPYDYGMYADEETGCQAYHVCYNGRRDSFLCGPGTVFNQRILHCDYWYSVDCAKSKQYWGSNAYMGSSQPEPGPAQAQPIAIAQPQPIAIAQPQAQSSYQSTEVLASPVGRPINRPLNSIQGAQPSYSASTQQIQENY